MARLSQSSARQNLSSSLPRSVRLPSCLRSPTVSPAETSPYLLQHAHNPVDWYPWGAEAFETARRDGKPVLLSIGYSACHWCHVMEHESFEDPETARLMNEHFVSIKVDREERPDLDEIYMNCVQMMTGHGGWPMTVFLTPDGEPFYGGTYFPPTDRHGHAELPPRPARGRRSVSRPPGDVSNTAAKLIADLTRIDRAVQLRRSARVRSRRASRGLRCPPPTTAASAGSVERRSSPTRWSSPSSSAPSSYPADAPSWR